MRSSLANLWIIFCLRFQIINILFSSNFYFVSRKNLYVSIFPQQRLISKILFCFLLRIPHFYLLRFCVFYKTFNGTNLYTYIASAWSSPDTRLVLDWLANLSACPSICKALRKASTQQLLNQFLGRPTALSLNWLVPDKNSK